MLVWVVEHNEDWKRVLQPLQEVALLPVHRPTTIPTKLRNPRVTGLDLQGDQLSRRAVVFGDLDDGVYPVVRLVLLMKFPTAFPGDQ